MDHLDFTLETKEEVQFITDNDPGLGWLANFEISPSNRIYVVIDTYVDKTSGEKIKSQLAKHNKKIIWMPFVSEEKNKGMANFVQMVKDFEANGLSRYDLVMGFGSGVLLDIVSFTASVYMRGVTLILVPTTLIGQVDAATAGKTCINSDHSKNLVGTLYMPRFVYNNIRFLDTLNEYHWRQGFSEIFKYGLLGSTYLLELLDEYCHTPSDRVVFEIIRETIKVRVMIRKKDPLASNLGHTFGHAIEKLSKFDVGHGDAIASGILMAVKFGEEQGITKVGVFKDILQRMEKLYLNRFFDPEWSIDNIVNLMGKDKKSSSKKINLVMISDIAKPYSQNNIPFFPIEGEVVHEFLTHYVKEFEHFSKPGLDKILIKGMKNN